MCLDQNYITPDEILDLEYKLRDKIVDAEANKPDTVYNNKGDNWIFNNVNRKVRGILLLWSFIYNSNCLAKFIESA